MPEEEEQPENETPQAAAPKKSGGIKDYLIYLLPAAPFVFYLLVFVISIALVLAILKSSEASSTPDFSGQDGQMTCSTWTSDTQHYQATFTAAAKAYGINPALVAAMFMSEHGGNLAAAAPWATSPKGAAGPFQFMPTTWGSNKVDGDKDGNIDIQNMTDSSFAAARYLQAQISIIADKNWQTEKESDIKAIAGCYNAGCGSSTNKENIRAYANGGDGSGLATETKNYMDKIWTYFQGLNVGCQNMTAYGNTNGMVFNSLADVENKFGSDPQSVQKYLATTTFFGQNVTLNKVAIQPLKNVESQIKATNNAYSIKVSGSYNWRANVNNKNVLSAHSFGLAIDVNASTNPNAKRSSSSASRDPNACQHDLPNNIATIFKKNGFFWGAEFKSICDPMHFQYGGNWI